MKLLPERPKYTNAPFKIIMRHPPGMVETDAKKDKKAKVDKQLVEQAKELRPKFEKRLAKNMLSVRSFIVDVAGLTLPTLSALEDSRDIIDEAIGVRIEPMMDDVMSAMRTAAKVRLWHWIPEYFKFTKQERELFLALVARPPEITDGKKRNSNKEFEQLLAHLVNKSDKAVMRELQQIRSMQRSTQESLVRLPEIRSRGNAGLPSARSRP